MTRIKNVNLESIHRNEKGGILSVPTSDRHRENQDGVGSSMGKSTLADPVKLARGQAYP